MVYLAIRNFCHALEGRRFSVYIDHKLLTHAFQVKPDRYSPREVRHLVNLINYLVNYLCQFTTDIRHVSGEENTVADALMAQYQHPRHNHLHQFQQAFQGAAAGRGTSATLSTSKPTLLDGKPTSSAFGHSCHGES